MPDAIKSANQQGRDQAGGLLLALRQAAQLSQSQLSSQLGVHVTFVSQLETGRTKLASDQIAPMARALKIAPRQLARELLSFYDPVLFGLVLGRAEPRAKALDATSIARSVEGKRFKDVILDILAQSKDGMTAPELQSATDAALGKPSHYSTAYMTLRRHALAGLVFQDGRVWRLMAQFP